MPAPLLIPIAAAGISAAGSLAQSIIDSRTQARNIEKTNQANLKLAEYQYSKDLEMWNKANEYNSPQMQMQRLQSAGLNPNLVYGSGAVANSTTQTPKFQAPTMNYNYRPPIDIPNALAMFQDFQLKAAQIDNLKAQKDVILQTQLEKELANKFASQTVDDRSRMVWQQRELMANKLGMSNYLMPYQQEMAKLNLQKLSTINQEALTRISRMQSQNEYQKLVNDWYVTKTIGQLIGTGVNAVSKIVPSFNLKHRR